MALKIIHVMEFQIVFRTNLVLFIFCIRIADTESNIWLEIMCAWFLLHCLVFKEHCLPLHQRFVKALQAFCKTAVWVSFYIISQSVHFVKNFFEIFFVISALLNCIELLIYSLQLCVSSDNDVYITRKAIACQHFFIKFLRYRLLHLFQACSSSCMNHYGNK